MNELFREINAEFEAKQKLAIDKAEKIKNTVYTKIPELKEIDTQISLLGINIAKEILYGNVDTNTLTNELKAKIYELKNKKNNLLISNNLPIDYLDIKYSCPLCKDTGYLLDENGIPTSQYCNCYKQRIIEKLYALSNINDLDNIGFEFFDENLFSDKVDALKYEFDISPRKQILRIKEAALDFINNFESCESHNLFFAGKTGVGKTFISKCIALEILKLGKTVLYLSAPQLFEILRKSKFNQSSLQESLIYNNIIDVNLLIIDDLGTEPQSDSKYSDLLNILNARLHGNKMQKTIISTNLELDEIYEHYTTRIGSRLVGEFDLYAFIGDDIRVLKKFPD